MFEIVSKNGTSSGRIEIDEGESMTKKKVIKELGPVEYHPYGEYIAKNSKIMIVGSFPIGKFTNPERKNEIDEDKEINFFYGGAKNKLWNLIGECFDEKLNSVSSIQKVLEDKGISVGDVVKSCRRINGSALDKDLKEIEWNKDLIQKIKDNGIKKILFTSKIVKTWFEENIAELNDLEYEVLISPSGAAMIWLSSTEDCKEWLRDNPGKKPKDYRLFRYKKIFK